MKRFSLGAVILAIIAMVMLLPACQAPGSSSGTGGGKDGYSSDGLLKFTYNQQYDGYFVQAGTADPSKKAPAEYTIPGTFNGKKVIAVAAPLFGFEDVEKIIVGDGVQMLGNLIFYGMENLEEVVLPDTLQVIGDSAFTMTAISSISIPDSVIAMGSNVFDACNNLEIVEVPFYRTPAGWDPLWDNAMPETAEIKYNYGNTGLAYLLAESGDGYICLGLPEGSAETDVVIPEEYNGKPVIGIGESAFSNMQALRTVKLPSSLKSIGEYAFNSCTALTEATLPEGLETIENGTFTSCHSLRLDSIPEGVKTIGPNAFFSCQNLNIEKLPASLETIDYGAFAYSSIDIDELPASVSTINRGAFRSTGITEITLSESLKSVADNIFEDCAELKTIYVPYLRTLPTGWDSSWNAGTSAEIKVSDTEKVYYAENENLGYAFVDGVSPDTKLKEIKIASEYNGLPVESIESEAFMNVTTITSVEIPDSVTSLGVSVFKGCTALVSVDMPSRIETIASSCFAGCTSLESITIPEGLEELRNAVFFDCTSLTEINLPKGLKTIMGNAFYNCSSLKELEIPEGVTWLYPFALAGCGIESISIPASVTKVDVQAFEGCDNLMEINVAWKEGEKPSGWSNLWDEGIPRNCVINYEAVQGGENPDNPGGGDLDEQAKRYIIEQYNNVLSLIAQQVSIEAIPGVSTNPSSILGASEYTITLDNVEITSGDIPFVLTGTYEYSLNINTYEATYFVDLKEGSSYNGEPHYGSWKTTTGLNGTSTTDITLDGERLSDYTMSM